MHRVRPTRKGGFIDVKGYDWGLYPDAERFLHQQIRRFLRRHQGARRLAARMHAETSTRFFDWIDHMVLPAEEVRDATLTRLGFQEVAVPSLGRRVFRHGRTIFFPVLVADQDDMEIAVKPEHLDDFLRVFPGDRPLEPRFAPFRSSIIRREQHCTLLAVERRGSNAFAPGGHRDIKAYAAAAAAFKKRRRLFATDAAGMRATEHLVRTHLKHLSPARTADAFFRAERAYWESRNHAGQLQRRRQDRLGLGWGNHDHHTYRASREHFQSLIRLFELMGYECRERFYAGEKAGWGAQILEHPQCDIVIFADVDITRAEKDRDFAHAGLAPRDTLGTVGLWIGLHGESILQSGMHHLEARFDFKALGRDLPRAGMKVMKPFSDFPFLKQAFTQGEQWPVSPARIAALLRVGAITGEQHDFFRVHGAIGSHLENLQRTQGYKGFNQDSVSAILRATDPRAHAHVHGHRGA